MTPRVNKDRLWNSLMEMAQIGVTEAGGCNRQALSDLDIQGRTLAAGWVSEVGATTRFDAAGNLYLRLDGQDPSPPPVMMGSHLDTQPTGGRFDGILGVLAGIEVIRTIAALPIRPQRPVEVVIWMNEEGSRFAPAMMGSGVFSGMLDLTTVRRSKDDEGVSVGEELDRHGYSSGSDPSEVTGHAYLELHIEQGPILESEGKSIGIVTGAQGIRWYDVSIQGETTHAGPTPMRMRKDPATALHQLMKTVFDIGTADEDARATIGKLQAYPGSRNVVPGSIELTVDLRHPDEETLSQMDKRFIDELARLRDDHPGLDIRSELIWHSPVVRFDPRLVGAVRKATDTFGYSSADIVSGAGHDALMVARRIPTTMIFIPCDGGVSHNEAENITPQQAEEGANVLLSSVLEILSQDA